MTTDPTRDSHDTGETGETGDTRPLTFHGSTSEAPADSPAPGTPGTTTGEERGGRHPLSISYLVAGLVFLGIAVSWALREAGVVDAGDSSWLFPLTLVVVGAIGLVASVVSSARRP